MSNREYGVGGVELGGGSGRGSFLNPEELDEVLDVGIEGVPRFPKIDYSRLEQNLESSIDPIVSHQTVEWMNLLMEGDYGVDRANRVIFDKRRLREVFAFGIPEFCGSVDPRDLLAQSVWSVPNEQGIDMYVIVGWYYGRPVRMQEFIRISEISNIVGSTTDFFEIPTVGGGGLHYEVQQVPLGEVDGNEKYGIRKRIYYLDKSSQDQIDQLQTVSNLGTKHIALGLPIEYLLAYRDELSWVGTYRNQKDGSEKVGFNQRSVWGRDVLNDKKWFSFGGREPVLKERELRASFSVKDGLENFVFSKLAGRVVYEKKSLSFERGRRFYETGVIDTGLGTSKLDLFRIVGLGKPGDDRGVKFKIRCEYETVMDNDVSWENADEDSLEIWVRGEGWVRAEVLKDEMFNQKLVRKQFKEMMEGKGSWDQKSKLSELVVGNFTREYLKAAVLVGHKGRGLVTSGAMRKLIVLTDEDLQIKWFVDFGDDTRPMTMEDLRSN